MSEQETATGPLPFEREHWLTIPQFVAHINGVFKEWKVGRMAVQGKLLSEKVDGKRLIHKDALSIHIAEKARASR